MKTINENVNRLERIILEIKEDILEMSKSFECTGCSRTMDNRTNALSYLNHGCCAKCFLDAKIEHVKSDIESQLKDQ
jgi:hypothetical protein